MKTKNSFGVHFTTRQNRMQDGKCPVYLKIVVNGSRTEFSLKSLVHLDDWNISKGMAKPKNQELKLLNNYLEDVRGRLFNHDRN